MAESPHKSWQKFLAPLVGAAVTALGVYASSESKDNSSRLAVVETRLDNVERLRDEVKELSRNVYTLIGEVRNYRSERLPNK